MTQIFPIIIDDSVKYSDDRIPAFLKDKFKAYNLQHIKNSQVAYRKIQSKYTKLLLDKNYKIRFGYSYRVFYGRKHEMAEFQKRYEEGQRIKVFVASGISGIGRRTFIVNTLRDSKVIPDYYEPPVVSLSGDDGIIDLICAFLR